jgi:hypothetical protein
MKRDEPEDTFEVITSKDTYQSDKKMIQDYMHSLLLKSDPITLEQKG